MDFTETQRISRSEIRSPSLSPTRSPSPIPAFFEYEFEPVTAAPATAGTHGTRSASPEDEELAFNLFSTQTVPVKLRSPSPSEDPFEKAAKEQKRPEGWYFHRPLREEELRIAVDGADILSLKGISGWVADRKDWKLTAGEPGPALLAALGITPEALKRLRKSASAAAATTVPAVRNRKSKPGKKRRLAIHAQARRAKEEEENRRLAEERKREKARRKNQQGKGKRREKAKLAKQAARAAAAAGSGAGGEGGEAGKDEGGDVVMKDADAEVGSTSA